MIDEDHLKHTLASVAASLAEDRAVTDVLHDLVDDASHIFDICGAAIAMADEQNRLRSVTALSEPIATLEAIEERTQHGPSHTRVRQWDDRQLEVAQLLADATAAYIVYASAYREATALVGQLQHALESRILIEQAKGMIAAERKISPDKAFELLRGHSRNHNASVHDVAAAVVNVGLRP